MLHVLYILHTAVDEKVCLGVKQHWRVKNQVCSLICCWIMLAEDISSLIRRKFYRSVLEGFVKHILPISCYEGNLKLVLGRYFWGRKSKTVLYNVPNLKAEYHTKYNSYVITSFCSFVLSSNINNFDTVIG